MLSRSRGDEMTDSHSDQSLPSWGVVSIKEVDPVVKKSDANVSGMFRTFQYTWEPPLDIRNELPRDFSLTFDCFIARDGVRRFMPRGGVTAFLPYAALGGFALLVRERQLMPEQRFTYHFNRLLFNVGPRLREYFGRTITRAVDLYVPEAGRISSDDRSILPSNIGLDPRGQGTAWTAETLIQRGKAAAGIAGNTSPDEEECIRRGLLEAARLNPLDMSEIDTDGRSALVRLAIFDVGPHADPLAQATIDKVAERLSDAVRRHVEDDTAQFNKWFLDNVDNIVHSLAKQKRGGGTLDRQMVRQAILELVFRSFMYTGDCTHLVMTAFARALPEPLSAFERDHFNALFRKQALLGGIPLVLLYDRSRILREVFQDVLADPLDARQIGVLFRMLEYYGTMVSNRRAADRLYKSRSGLQNKSMEIALAHELHANTEEASSTKSKRFHKIAEELRAIRGAKCPCGITLSWLATLDAEDDANDTVVIDDDCETCGHHETIRVSWEQIRIADSMINDTP